MTKPKILYIRLSDADLAEWLDWYTANHGMTYTELVIAALREYSERHE